MNLRDPAPSRLLVGAAVLLGILALIAALRFAAAPPASRLPLVPLADGAGAGVRITYPADRAPVLTLPDGRSEPVRSVLNVGRVLDYGDFVWNDQGVPAGPLTIRVDLARQLLSVFRGGHEIGTALILYGAEDKQTPHGMLKILAKAENYYSHTYDAPMPFMLRLTDDGVAIHASDVRAAAATHGCIGVPLAFARHLYAAARIGDPVGIIG